MNIDIVSFSPDFLNFIWLGIFIILIIIELLTVGLTTIWFAVGSLAALAANELGAGLIIQLIVFLIVSCLLLVFTRPWALKHINRKRIRTNYEKEIGKVILLTERVDNLKETGKSIVDGQEWTVRSKNDEETFEAGEKVVVSSVSGVKLIVEKCKEDSV